MTPDPWCQATRHGDTYSIYQGGCRCTPARAANAAYRRQRRADGHPLVVDSIGTRRRLQALAAAGWPLRELAERLYVVRPVVHRWMTLERRIFARNAALIAALYDDIGLAEGTSPWSSRMAARNGWPSPIEWGDDIDDPAAKPLVLDRIRSSHDPLSAAPWEDVELIVRSGETWETAAARLGTTRHTLDRRLARAGRTDLSAALSRSSEQYERRTA